MKLVSFSVAGGKTAPGALVEEADLVVDLTPRLSRHLAAISAGITIDRSARRTIPATN